MLSKIKRKLLLLEPFWGYQLLKLKDVPREDGSIGHAMATDGIHLYYVPSYVKNTPDDEVTVVVIHELLHCVFLHPARFKPGMNFKIANYAADYAINAYIRNMTNYVLPDWMLYEDRFVGLSFEAIYKILYDECAGTPDQQKVDASEKSGSVMPTPADAIVDEDSQTTLKDYWEGNIQEAAAMVRQAGKSLSELEQLVVAGTLPAQLSWETILKRFVKHYVKAGSDWSRPNRRHLHKGMYLPSRLKKPLYRLLVAIDTSGSVDEHQFKHMIAEINEILLKLVPSHFTLIQCDTAIREVKEYSPKEYPINPILQGRGGTEFSPVFEHVAANKLKPSCLVYFTDLESDFRFDFPQYPVLWINTSPYNKAVAPFGTTIRVHTE